MGNHKIKFEIGFWHPFGPHCDEMPDEIIARKRQEIKNNGWTLWSFKYRKLDTLKAWYEEILKEKPRNALVFCSDGVGAKSPKGRKAYCQNYIPVNDNKSQKVPSNIKVLHHLGERSRGTAFVIQDIIYPVDYKLETVQWLYQKQEWRNDKIPTRSEYLIKAGKGELMRKYRAILVLKPPYLAQIMK